MRRQRFGRAPLMLGALVLCLAPLGFAEEVVADETAANETAEPEIVQRSKDRDDLPSLAEVLGAPDDEAIEALSERCLQTFRIRSHQILDEQHIVWRMRNGDRYLTQFPRRCIGLRRGNALRLDTNGGRLCRLDTVRAVPRDSFSIDPGVPCMINGFQRISPEQVAFLRESLKRR